MFLGPNKLRPTFFIGLGGSGGRVVDVLAKRLAAEPAFERFRELVHFVAVDTDMNDLERLHPRVMKTNISVAHKPRRVALLRGEEAGLGEDQRATSWIHPGYRFREQSNAGAGQIRLEARFSLHCQLLEQAPNNLVDILKGQLARSLRAQEPNRGHDKIRFHLWASTAGGTGSGASLVTAALLRRLAREIGAECEVFGHFFLPSLFRDRVAPALITKIDANGYAALKEIERFQELRYEGGPDPIELVFDPRGEHGKKVTSRDEVAEAPFDWVYLVDKPEAMSIEQIYAAAGEAAYLQLFSPILGYEQREADNFRQLQTRLAAGYFALQNGAIGASVVELPRDRLVRYCARRLTAEALSRFLVATSSTHNPTERPDWKTLSEAEQGRRLDQAFLEFIATEARAEEEQKLSGVFTEVAAMRSLDQPLVPALLKKLGVELQAAEDLAQVDSINAAAITPENTSLNAQRDAVMRDLQRARQALAEKAVALEGDIASGRFFQRFFEQYQVPPLTQRALLIELDRLAREGLKKGDETDERLSSWCLVPFDDPADGLHLGLPPADPSSWRLTEPDLRKQLDQHERALDEAGKKLFRKEQAFAERRQAVTSWFNQLRDTAQEALVVDFWQRVGRALESQVQTRLETFRVLAKQGAGLVSHLVAEAERCRESGQRVPPIAARRDASDSSRAPGHAGQRQGEPEVQFHLGSEVFHDERHGVRAWDEVFRLVVEPGFHVPSQVYIQAMNRHLEDRARAASSPSSNLERLVFDIAADLDALVVQRLDRHLREDSPLTLGRALILEAQLHLTGHRATTRRELDAVPLEPIRAYLEEKLSRARSMSRPLGRFDEPVLAGREFSPYRPRFFGVHASVLSDAPLLSDVFGVAASGFERLEDWSTPDVVSFYQATLGVPLYAWQEVKGALVLAYEHESQDKLRKEPLQIDHRWEEPTMALATSSAPGLPGLDPGRRMRWEEGQRRLMERGQRDLATVLGAGLVGREDGRWRWSFRGRTGDLGPSLETLVTRWAALTPGLREPLIEAARLTLSAEPHRRAHVITDLKGLRFDAEAEGRRRDADLAALLIAHLERPEPHEVAA